jgi:hypothetical protein
MADFNLEGLLGNVFGGGGGNYLDEYLTEDQRRMMQRNAMLAASAALLKAGGESTRRIGIGEALGGAFEAGQAGYEKAQTGALTQMALKQKLKDAETERATKLAFKNFLTQQGGGAAPPAVDAAPPTVTQTNLNATGPQVPPSLAAPAPSRQTNLSQNQLQLLSMMDMKTAIPELMKSMQQPKTAGDPFRGADGKIYIRTEYGGAIPFTTGMAPKPVGQPQAVMMDGKPTLVQGFDDGSEKILSDRQPYEALSSDIRAVEYLKGAPLGGTGQTGIQQVGQYRQQIAPRTDVRVGGPILENAEQKGMGEFNIETFKNVSTAAGLAQKTLPSLDIQSQILNKGFTTGFGTEVQKAGASVLAALGVPEANRFATDAQTFLAATQQAVLQKQLEQKGPQTEADSRRVTQTGAQLGNTVDANRFLIDVAREQLKRDIERKTFLESWWNTNKTLRGADDAWYTGAGGQSLFDRPGLKKYVASTAANQIPTDAPVLTPAQQAELDNLRKRFKR